MAAATSLSVQASVVAMDGRGILLTGPPGSGKSELAVQLVDRGALLVADDLVSMALVGGWLHALPAARYAGRIMLRGVGLLDVPRTDAPVPMALAVAAGRPFDPAALHPERSDPILDCRLPQIAIDPARASAAAVIVLALDRWGL